MKKFYYKKETDDIDCIQLTTRQQSKSDFEKKRAEVLKSLNLKTPIILQLDRRLNINREGDVSRFRATSISSLDQFRDIPKIPRVRTRDVTKSLSEDFLAANNSFYAHVRSPSAVVITESELSSSWLYNNRKDAANFSQTPLKSRYRSEPNLSPVMLQDPKMKPIPVKRKTPPGKASFSKCYIMTMVIICLCTLGFLSTIGGVIYLELTSTQSDKSDSPSKSLPDTTDQDYEVNPKTSDERAEVNIDQRTLDAKDESTKRQMRKIDDLPDKSVHILDFEKKPDADLTQYIDNTKTEIMTHEDKSIVYDGNTKHQVEFTDDSDTDSQSNGKDTESQNENDKLKVVKVLENDIVSSKIDISNNLNTEASKTILIGPIPNNEDSGKVELDKQEEVIETKTVAESEEGPNHSNQNFENASGDNKLEEHEVMQNGEKVNDLNTSARETIELFPIISNIFQEVDNPVLKQENDENSALLHISLPSGKNTVKEELEEKDSDFDSIVTAINEHIKSVEMQEIEFPKTDIVSAKIEENSNSIGSEPANRDHKMETRDEFTKKNGVMNIEIQGNSKPKTQSAIVIEAKSVNKFAKSKTVMNTEAVAKSALDEPISEDKVIPDESDLAQKEQFEPISIKPQVNIRVSLAEAMKHLQVLDTQNKILSSRIRPNKPRISPNKPKIKITRPRTQTVVRQPVRLQVKEKIDYLNNIRFKLMSRLRNEM